MWKSSAVYINVLHKIYPNIKLCTEEIQWGEKEAANRPERCHKKDQVLGSRTD
jgi:hypothetical protein